jgi:hypothetical protein
MSQKDFESASVIYGDINDFIERVWSEERYNEAVCAFEDAVVIHDICTGPSAVHTDYRLLRNAPLHKDRTILTHSPDKITSEWALCDTNKSFKIKGKKFFEIVGNSHYPMNADVYYKEDGRYLVGYRNEKGNYTVYDQDGLLSLLHGNKLNGGTPLFNVDVYEDISGKYFPLLEDKNVMYRERKDGRVEIVEVTEEGSRGRIIEDHRGTLGRRDKGLRG